ncbi:hypothetical protein [Acidomonas methanolica]|uniref:hypothetical protein n=1 Tax=Acidomonas methanolica TaxID=437 RepID=UPI0010496CEC|nr:hypothetical protein [Acidomonas methanolica]
MIRFSPRIIAILLATTGLSTFFLTAQAEDGTPFVNEAWPRLPSPPLRRRILQASLITASKLTSSHTATAMPSRQPLMRRRMPCRRIIPTPVC